MSAAQFPNLAHRAFDVVQAYLNSQLWIIVCTSVFSVLIFNMFFPMFLQVNLDKLKKELKGLVLNVSSISRKVRYYFCNIRTLGAAWVEMTVLRTSGYSALYLMQSFDYHLLSLLITIWELFCRVVFLQMLFA